MWFKIILFALISFAIYAVIVKINNPIYSKVDMLIKYNGSTYYTISDTILLKDNCLEFQEIRYDKKYKVCGTYLIEYIK